ncbi:phospholipid scramblase-related protein [Pseudanabaena mucicola]|uniref:Scramblase n=1 Tax=Pseudanabaena mucicola FACHB-723 TaxID=2692860 RepID=A0ABR8A1L4_9CYAN|nr:phospholipid scramblase-related protein [Pseudanabaena mucicola]MBD2190015.1 hypothetical protein [Pseudanabaena mucicola FACHB-723]
MDNFIQTLAQANSIYIKQKFEVAEIFGFETRNRYQIQSEDGLQFGYCAEQKLGLGDAIMRQFLGHWRVFNIIGTDIHNQQVFRAHHPFRWFFQRIDVFGAGDRQVGSLQQRFAWFNKKFDFLDTRGNLIMSMTSPFWSIWTFPIKKLARDVAVIEKKWSGISKELFTDADNFRVRFSDSRLTADDKLLLLAGAIFIDILYFERKAS